jgi:hypothetical protein
LKEKNINQQEFVEVCQIAEQDNELYLNSKVFD